jgi:hypothetical protein
MATLYNPNSICDRAVQNELASRAFQTDCHESPVSRPHGKGDSTHPDTTSCPRVIDNTLPPHTAAATANTVLKNTHTNLVTLHSYGRTRQISGEWHCNFLCTMRMEKCYEKKSGVESIFKKKVKVPRNRLESPDGGRGIALHSLDLGARRWRVVSTIPSRERTGSHCTGGWVGPRARLDVCQKSATWDLRLYFRSEGRNAEGLFPPEKSDGFGRVRTRELGYQRPAC